MEKENKLPTPKLSAKVWLAVRWKGYMDKCEQIIKRKEEDRKIIFDKFNTVYEQMTPEERTAFGIETGYIE